MPIATASRSITNSHSSGLSLPGREVWLRSPPSTLCAEYELRLNLIYSYCFFLNLLKLILTQHYRPCNSVHSICRLSLKTLIYCQLVKKWLQLTGIRTAAALLVIGLVVSVLIWLPVQSSRKLVSNQLSVTSSGIKKLKEAENLLTGLPTIENVQLQQMGSAKAYAENANKVAGNFSALTIIRPKRIKPIFGLNFSQSQIVSDVNGIIVRIKQHTLYKNAAADIQSADRLMVYHAAVSGALVNILEYNPTKDTKNFSLQSDDTKKRLDLAQQGLRKADQRLQEAQKMYEDPSLNEVTASISVLRAARFKLTQDANTKEWIKVFSEQQQKIVKNRTVFWQKAKRQMVDKLSTTRNDLLQIQDLWRNTAQKHKIKT